MAETRSPECSYNASEVERGLRQLLEVDYLWGNVDSTAMYFTNPALLVFLAFQKEKRKRREENGGLECLCETI